MRCLGRSVSARSLETGAVRTVVSDAQGRFVVTGLPVGTYELRVELAGFRPTQSRVELVVGSQAVVPVVLLVGGITEAVTVSGGAAAVNVTSSELSYLVSRQAIEQLPLNGRNYTDLALLQPGVHAYPHRDGGSVVAHGLAMSVNGQDPRSNVYLLDGTLQNDFTNGPAGSAAGTALGMETIREFRVETNAYGAEFGRNSGGQVHVVTKSGSNDLPGSAFEYHRNDAFDARNYFDRGREAGLHAQPVRRHPWRPAAAESGVLLPGLRSAPRASREDDLHRRARRQRAPGHPAGSGECRGTISVPVNAAVRPYLDEFPRANGPSLGGGLAEFTFPFNHTTDQHFVQGRVDYQLGPAHQFFGRYTFDDADQHLPTDYPQFPRAFRSRNQFFTGEYRQVASDRTLHTLRFGVSRTRIGQSVESNTSGTLTPFVPGRPYIGNLDIGGLKRFGPQSSAGVQLVQNVFSLQHDIVHTRGRHLIKAGGLAERYQDNMVNPTFSLGIYRFANLATFFRNQPISFVGLTPEGAIDRYWRFMLFGAYVQDEFRVGPRLTLNGGLRYEFMTLPEEKYGRDSALINLSDPAPTPGPLYQNPTARNLSPRGGFAWDIGGDGRTSLRGGYGLYFNTNNQQNLIVTVTNPPATPRLIITNPTFPSPPFERGIGNSIRPVQWDLENPRVHVWNVNLQRALPWDTVVTVGYAGSRGTHLLRSSDVNVPDARSRWPTARCSFPAGSPRPNRNFSTIELKSSDGDSWYKALILDVRRRWSRRAHGPVVVHAVQQRRHDTGVHLLLRRDQRHDDRVSGVRSRLQQGAVGLRRETPLGDELHLGAAVRARAVRRRQGGAGWLARVGHPAHAERQPADRLCAEQPVALAVDALARPGHRFGPPQLRAGL